jgi:hypothetical protein
VVHWFQPYTTVELLRLLGRRIDRRIFLPALALFLLHCTTPPAAPPHGQNDSAKANNRLLKKPASSYEDSLLVSANAAVFFRPDSLQMEKIKTIIQKAIFETLAHDCYYQMRNAKTVISRDYPTVRIVDASGCRWVIFRKKNGGEKPIDLNAIGDICGLFLFDGTKDPVRADMPNIDTYLWNYFGSRGKRSQVPAP